MDILDLIDDVNDIWIRRLGQFGLIQRMRDGRGAERIFIPKPGGSRPRRRRKRRWFEDIVRRPDENEELEV